MQFPVEEHLESLCSTLKNSPSRCIILTAETGAGKSTIFPMGLLKNFSGRILMTQPRRLSVLGTSERISTLLNEKNGNTCGYRIHLETNVSKNTRLEIVTEAILLRMIQEDFALENFNVIVLDEFHERSCNLDLISCFLKEAMSVRDDLFVVIMSATIDAKKISHYFYDAPIIEIPGRTFPVEIEYKKDASIENAIIEELKSSEKGNILAFLPGIREIRQCVENLRQKTENDDSIEILPLHSSIDVSEQKNILKESSLKKRRIIVSSAIAETSVTVPGVTCVIDSGLSRTKIFDPSTGMEKLVTIAASEFSAAQRAGRAGRTQKGKCIRLWSKNDIRPKEHPCEILRSELSSLILECAERGITDYRKIDFIDAPARSSWEESLFLLKEIGMISQNGRISEKGKLSTKLPVDVRTAGIILASFGNSEYENFAKKIYLKNSSLNEASEKLKNDSWNDILERIKKSGWKNKKFLSDKKLLLLEGYADRLAKKIESDSIEKNEYQFVTGRKAFLHQQLKINSEWIAATQTDAGTTSALIFEAEEISGKEFDKWIDLHKETVTECSFENGTIKKEEKQCIGKIVLKSKKLQANESDLILAWKNEIEKKGFEALPLDDNCRSFLTRVEFYRQQKNEEKNLEAELIENLDLWLAPFLGGIKKLDSKTTLDALRYHFNGTEIDREVPEIKEFENGRKFKIHYERNEKIIPVAEIIIQRIFGCFTTPRIMGQKILLKLNSPASRPLQITDDLENFWTTSWIEICREMKGRYPKHNWDYRIAE